MANKVNLRAALMLEILFIMSDFFPVLVIIDSYHGMSVNNPYN